MKEIKLLIPTQPLLVLPELATRIGLNEAIVLQQIHYWIQTSPHHFNGKRWIYNSYEGWQKQFPFWSIRTIKRIFKRLEKLGLIEIANFNNNKFDKTNWYSINYQNIPTLDFPIDRDNLTPPECQSGTIDSVPDCPHRECQFDTIEGGNLAPPIPETTNRDYIQRLHTETTTENISLVRDNCKDRDKKDQKGDNCKEKNLCDAKASHVFTDVKTSVEPLKIPPPQKDSSDPIKKTKNRDKMKQKDKQASLPACPYQEILNLYHKILPELPKVRALTSTRKKYLRTRWKEVLTDQNILTVFITDEKDLSLKEQGLLWFEKFFEYVKKSDFLCGKVPPGKDRDQPFIADLEWLMRPNNFVKVLEGRYHTKDNPWSKLSYAGRKTAMAAMNLLKRWQEEEQQEEEVNDGVVQ